MRATWCLFFFFFNDTATTEIYTLSLHDALPIYATASLSPGAKGFLDRRQRFFASRSPGSPKAPGQVSQPGARTRARPCQLAQSNRNLFLDHPTKGPDAQRFFFSTGVGRPSTGF